MKNEFLSFLNTLPQEEMISLSNGTANTIYRCGSYLIRHKKEDTTDLSFQSPLTEKEAYQVLGDNPIVPALLLYDDSGNKVERFALGRHFDKTNPKDLEKVASTLAHLHAIPIAKSQTRFRALERLLYYKGIAASPLYPHKEEAIILDASPYLSQEGQCLCHNDLWAGNILINENKAILIDLEFAEASFPAFDLASLIEENELNQEQSEIFLRAYYGDEPTPKQKQEIHALVGFHHILWYYWALCRYKETKGKAFLNIASLKRDAFLSFDSNKE